VETSIDIVKVQSLRTSSNNGNAASGKQGHRV
jgi:hypothetical protein